MIRPLRKEDKELFFTLTREFYTPPAVLRPISDGHRERTWAELMRPDSVLECCIFEQDGQAAGYTLLIRSFSQEAGGPILWVDELYVRPAFRSRGLARELLRSLMARDDLAGLRLEVEPENPRAAELYRRLGFEALPYRPMIWINPAAKENEAVYTGSFAADEAKS